MTTSLRGRTNSWVEASCSVTTLISLVNIGTVTADMFLISHMNPRDHMFKASCEFICGRSPRVSHHLATFGGHQSSANGDKKCLICHSTSQNHAIEQSCNFFSGISSWHDTILPSLMATAIVVVEICSQFFARS